MTRNIFRKNNEFTLAKVIDEKALGPLDPYASRALDQIGNALSRKAWPKPQPIIKPAPPLSKPGESNSGESKKTESAKPPVTKAPKLMRALSQDQALIDLLKVRPIRELVEKLEKVNNQERLIDLIGDASQTGLLYQVEAELEDHMGSFNQQQILKREGIVTYLFVYALAIEGLKEPEAIARWIADERDGGIREIYEAVVDFSIRDFVNRERVEVGDRAAFDAYAAEKIATSNYSLVDNAFEQDIASLTKGYAFDFDNFQLINATMQQVGIIINDDQLQMLNNFIKNSSFPITANNAHHILPNVLNEHTNGNIPVNGSSIFGSQFSYSVNFYDEDQEALAVNTENINEAAKLFYAMTLGDELGVFDAADLLITNYLASGKVDVRNPATLAYLQQYAFGEEFTDTQSGQVLNRTQPEERQMFYRQVFNLGDGEMMAGAIYNAEFENAMYNLITEVAHYITQLNDSQNPVAFVPRQYVAQAAEDLRYNLSMHCTGMAKAITPIINKEMDFVVKRFFEDEEIIQQLALHNSRSMWKVIERILWDRDGDKSVNVLGLYSKAKTGNLLLHAVASFTPNMVGNDGKFSDFVSTVQAYITANSRLEQEPGRHRDLPEEEFERTGVPGMGSGIPGMNVNGSADDDWNF